MKDDKIYEMLSDAEIDLNEYEVEELSSEEKERYKTRIRMEVKRMNMETRNKNKKNKSIRKCGRNGSSLRGRSGSGGIF